MEQFSSVSIYKLVCLVACISSSFANRMPNEKGQSSSSPDQVPSLNYKITQQWDSRPPRDNAEILLKISSVTAATASGSSDDPKSEHHGLVIEIDAPFYNDPIVPPSHPIGSTDKLWNYEVVEVFFLSETEKRYLETEFGPQGHYLLLELDTERNVLKNEIPLGQYTAVINEETGRWQGRAVIPWGYLPKDVNKFNAYAIHKSDPERVYMSLFPTPYGRYAEPNFHRLAYFQNINLTQINGQ